MAKDFFGWSRWSPHLGNAITIATGFPVVIGMLAGLWAYFSGAGLHVALVGLASFVMSLWSYIGILWLIDRTNNAASISKNFSSCAWGLRFDSAILNRDPGMPDFEWQIKAMLRNSKPFPIRIDYLEQRVVIENRVPDTKLSLVGVPIVIGAGEASILNFPAFSRNNFPDKDRINGEMLITARYGKPDEQYSRVTTKRFGFNALIRPSAQSGIPVDMFPIAAAIPLGLSLLEEEVDEPYTQKQA